MSERPSRQQLVVSKKRSNLPLVIGAVASAGIGFAAVWAIGLTRPGSTPTQEEVLTLPVTTIHDPATGSDRSAEPNRFSPPGAPNPAQAVAPVEQSPGDRYGIHQASLEAPEGIVRTAAESPRMSRFSGAGSEASDLPVADAAIEQPAPEEPAPAAAREETSATERAESEATAATTDIEPEAGPSAESAASEAATPPAPLADTLPEDAGDLVAHAPLPVPNPVSPPPAPAANPIAAATPGHDQEAPIPHSQSAAGAQTTSATGNPLRRAPAALAAAVPFAAAPPIAPTPFSGSPAAQDPFQPAPGASAPADGATGQGRPGPMQLEGVQSPQLTVEKRGPREVQVGKAVRYEILVRNVGAATAHDVMLRDSVPYGTALIATTPPASPVNPASGTVGDLAWMLGSLPPGGQARVAMEVMPKIEGDVGSVASVTFRADASARSRATKPDLRIESAQPKPVLIGKEVRFPIKITNPGTGIATGVVLEGLLPDGLVHKAGRELEFDVGQLQPGASRTIDIVLGSTGPGVHNMHLAARADGQIEVEQVVRIEVTAPTLELAAEMPARRYLQRPAVCVIAMGNTGTAPAKSVKLAAQLPPGVKFVRANNAGYYEERTHRVLWNLEELPAGETGRVEVVVMPIELGPQKIMAAARSADGLSDQIAHTIEVEGLAAVSFEVTDSEDPIEVAGVTEYVIRVGNQGTKAASGVRLTATLLGEMEPLEAKGPAAHRIENLTIAFEPLAKLAPSEEAVFRVRVRGHREGDQRVQVQLTSDDHPSPITKEEITRVYADR